MTIPLIEAIEQTESKIPTWSDDFEGYSVNVFPDTWVGSGNAGASGNYITNEESYSGDKSLRLQGVYGGCWEAVTHRYLNLSNKVGNSYIFEFAIKVGKHVPGSCHYTIATVSLHTGASWTTNQRPLFIFSNEGNTTYIADRAIGNFTGDTWYFVKIKYHWISNSTIQIYWWINNEYKGNASVKPENFENNINYFTLHSGDGITWFDDISVSSSEDEFSIVPVAVAVSTIAGTSIVLFFVITETGKYKFLSFLALFGPLFTRFKNIDDLQQNEKRHSMYEFIEKNQPVTYNELKKSCNISNGELYWHAQKMIQQNAIKMEKKGFHLFFYMMPSVEKEIPPIPSEKFIKLNSVQQEIFDYISSHPGSTQSEISESLSIKQQNISYNLLNLEKTGMIKIEKKGRRKIYFSK
ncbi:MAG: winged helix-turn-helix transcriptional regulator [Candidatus Thermoplasmatota archaeon]|nr:winged helix-turn-helix transcriptional regulator [Candidatus Thermoplasmatota archaeon]